MSYSLHVIIFSYFTCQYQILKILFHCPHDLCMVSLNGCVNSMLLNKTILVTLEITVRLAVFHHRHLGQYIEQTVEIFIT